MAAKKKVVKKAVKKTVRKALKPAARIVRKVKRAIRKAIQKGPVVPVPAPPVPKTPRFSAEGVLQNREDFIVGPEGQLTPRS